MTDGHVRTIKVADIIEYPTELGTRCKILKCRNISTYTETPELLHDILVSSVQTTELEVCKNSSHCAAFYRLFSEGRTPFLDKDPIILRGYAGRYIITVEGKHRVCMAKRMGIDTINAYVLEADSDWFYHLKELGEAKTYTFRCTPKACKFPLLWVISKPFDFSIFDVPTLLNNEMNCMPINGISVDVSRYTQGFFGRVGFDINVSISEGHEKTKVWLMELNLNTGRYDTLYRRGLWRKRHLHELRRDTI